MLRAALLRFASNPKDPLLHTHKLKGELKDCWAFGFDADLRVVFRWVGEEAFLVNFGSHDEVY
jgi:mRNA-degrading endonuclease YafQ of YafQ-DinJ toxin-antitoxin module